jgi:hypothetical protein
LFVVFYTVVTRSGMFASRLGACGAGVVARLIAHVLWESQVLLERFTCARAGDVQNSMAPIVAGKTGASAFVLYSGHDDGPIMPILSGANADAIESFCFVDACVSVLRRPWCVFFRG